MRVAVEGEETLVIGGETFVVSPLSLAQVKRAKALIGILTSDAEGAEDAAADLISMGLISRHPDMTPERVADILPFRDLLPAIDKVLLVGGLKPTGPAGEAKAG